MNKPKRFVGLHAHDGFSTFDGLDYPQDHIDFVRSNGMEAFAITNHGHMNSFAHAYLHVQKLNKKGANFKFIPGCEMYVHPDLQVWQTEYELKRARKKGEQSEIDRLLRIKEELASPLFALTDGDDEIIDIGKATDAGLTVENEEETKSNKFFDPIKRRHHLVVLPRTSVGLQRLFHLVSRGYKEGFYRFPRVDYQMIKEAAKGGHLMLSTACLGGPLSYEVFRQVQGVEFDHLGPHLLDDPELMNRVMTNIGNGYQALVDSVGLDAVMLELQFNKLGAQHLVNRALIEFARQNSLQDKLIVTCDSHYSHPDHWKEREIYKKLGWLNYKSMNPDEIPQTREELKCELYPKNAEQVWDSYHDTTEGMSFYNDEEVFQAIERTHDVAHEMIGDIHPDCSMKLPSYVIPENQTADSALISAAKKGLVERGLHEKPGYLPRLKEELRIIASKKFSEYFLTMKAIIDIAKTKMFVGPGRGSGAGSLVNYVLGITDVDPIEYDLLFERFMSPERTEMPDIDTDVGDRDLLIDMLKEKFGDDNIVPISNYNTFKLKSLIKDVSRFYGIEFSEVNKALAPLQRDILNGRRRAKVENPALMEPTFEEAMEYSESVRNFIGAHPEVAEPLGVLFKQNKALGRHAGGVIVSENIAERMPLIMARGECQTPWVEGMSYKHLEHFGWIKFDLLGLETLRIIQRTIELILKRSNGVENPSFDQVKDWFRDNMASDVIDFNDQHVYKNIYHSGKWAGIFQCTNGGSQKLFKRAKPTSIIDIATLTSIYRPGPLSAKVDKLYIKSKNNPEEVVYKHPLIKEVLEETYGCIIFQEQVMKLCNLVAGIPKAECNAMRKMMKPSKSSTESLEKARLLKIQFIEGAVANGVKKHDAEELYEKILYFAGYGFNKSHAVSYALDSYYCAWMMTYHEEEWLCAYLESMEGNPKKRAKAFSEVQSLGYKMVPIDINEAQKQWTILEGKRFMPSFLSCKGIGEAAVDEIIRERPYTDIKTMLWKDDGKWRHSKFNKKAMESLIKIRAFRSMEIVESDVCGNATEFDSYRHMHDSLIPNWDKLRKSLKRNQWEGYDNFINFREDNRGCGEWTKKEMIFSDLQLFGSVNPASLVTDSQRQKLAAKNILSLDKWTHQWLYWFISAEVKPATTKNGRPYLRIKALKEDGSFEWMNCWGWNKSMLIEPYTLCVAVVDANDYGKSTKWSKLKISGV